MAINLDQPDSFLPLDSGDMMGLTLAFPAQCRKAMEIGDSFTPPPALRSVRKVICCGLGGSAIAADLVSHLYADRAPVPIQVNRQYNLPAWVDEDTLVVLTSYSGNTEETLSAFRAAQTRKSQIACITSGGKLGELAATHDIPVIIVPGGQPPRASTGYLIFPLLAILGSSGLIPALTPEDKAEALAVLEGMSKALAPDKPTRENPAKDIAQWLAQGYPIIYGWDYLSPVALRWQTQLNENSKVIAHAGALPEMNHNEVVAWAHASDLIKKMRVLLLRSPEEEPAPIKARFELTKQIIIPNTEVREALPQGKGKLARQLSLVYLSDIASIYLAFLGEKDPIEINAINFLKGELAKISG